MPNKIIPQEHRDAMVAAYLAGATAKEAANQFGYSYMACIFALKQKGIEPRTNGETHRKYAVDETFFDVIDTEAKAYWLGFLTADGTIGDNHITLGLQEQDVPHLHKFTDSLQSNHPIDLRESSIKGKTYRYGQVHIGSMRLALALRQLGVGERKSFVVCPCELIPDGLLPHYWRGVFDGDGFIISARSREVGAMKWSIGLVGNVAMVKGFDAFVQQYVKTQAVIRPHSRIFMIRYEGVAVPQSVIRLLYRDATISLDRKQKLANDIQQTLVQRVDRSGVTKESLERLYALHGTWDKVAAELGTSRGRLYHLRKRVELL
jgi:hypothetical protein